MFNFNHSSSLAYTILIGLIALQRVAELIYSKKNEKRLFEKGALEFGKKTYVLIVIYQTAWLLTCLIGDFFVLNTPSFIEIFIGFILLIVGQFFRIMSIATLKSRWTTKIIVVPSEPIIQKGIYRYLKHPNYLGVILESFALPLMAGLWELSIILGIISTIVMLLKTHIEESALIKYCGYDKIFGTSSKSNELC